MNCSGLKNMLLSAPLLFLAACGDQYTAVDDQTILPGAKRYDDTVMTEGEQRLSFSRLSRPASFGLRYGYDLPEQSRDKATYVVVSGKARSNMVQSGAVIAMVTHYDSDQLSWMVVPMKVHLTDTNTWCPFRDSVYLTPRQEGRIYNNITAVAHLVSAQERFDLDQLHVVVKQKQ